MNAHSASCVQNLREMLGRRNPIGLAWTGRGFEWFLVTLSAITLLAAGSGCQSTRSFSNEPTYVRSFRIGAFDAALEQARLAPTDERARLIAGMSQHALGRGGDAQQDLESLSNSRDRQIRGRALATLALIEYEAGNSARAVSYLDSAIRDLEPPEKDRATWFRRALGGGDETLTGGWLVQVGAFENATRAERAARSGRAQVWPSPIEVQRETSAGRTLHVVRVGRFVSRAEAEVFAEQVGGFVRPVE